jgi:translation initiation factor IF-3
VRFRGREITHPEKAHEQLDVILKALDDVANVETRPMMEARAMSLVVAPKPALLQRVAQLRAAQEKARQTAEKEGRSLPPAPSSVELPHDEEDDEEDEDEDEEDGEQDGGHA